jgi:antitoxin VapB
MSGPVKAKLFMNGRSQAVRLPKEFQMPGNEVFIRKEGNEVILSTLPAPTPRTIGEFIELIRALAPGDDDEGDRFVKNFYEAKEAEEKYERENPKRWLSDPNAPLPSE